MAYASSWLHQDAGSAVLIGIIGSLAGILWLLAVILVRRWYRARYFARRDAHLFAIRERWNEVLDGSIVRACSAHKLDREILETLLLDALDGATNAELPPLHSALRTSGILDQLIFESRSTHGRKKQVALVALGRTRVAEAIPALVEALDHADVEIRIAAVRGLGRTALPEAGRALLSHAIAGQPLIPEPPLKDALLNCCRTAPDVLLTFLRLADGHLRSLIARVLAEVLSPALGDDILALAGDPSPELRASAARGLAQFDARTAVPYLATLAADDVWFVRLRAVVALGSLQDAHAIEPLIGCLCDPHRLVRLRAAAALVAFTDDLVRIMQAVVATNDRYALQAFVSELERTGRYFLLLSRLEHDTSFESRWVLTTALESARHALWSKARASASAAAVAS